MIGYYKKLLSLSGVCVGGGAILILYLSYAYPIVIKQGGIVGYGGMGKVKVKVKIDQIQNKYFICSRPTISFNLLRMWKILYTFAVELIRVRLSPTYSHYFGAV